MIGSEFLSAVYRAAYVFVGVGLLALCLWMLWPGLHGNFYLDDFPNLSPLESAGRNGTPLFSYLLNPAVSGLGRPVSYLTFLLQQEHWPDSPFYFKLVNLAIHIVNGILVFCIAMFALRLTRDGQLSRSSIFTVAAGCSLIWIVLPIHASAIFYVVQRMTLLSALFTLGGIAGYLWIRLRHKSWGKKQYALAGFLICFGYIGVLAKENAIQTGILIWAFELTILSKNAWKPSRWFQGVFFLAPMIALVVYLFVINDVLSGYGHRDFTLKERLLTQVVIFWEYVSKVFFPTPSRLHLFNDGGEVYGRIFNDLAVMVSLVGLISSFVLSIWMRKRFSWFSFAFLFFCFGHLLESTFIPLEMNFEHRNYLPAVGLILGVLIGLIRGLESCASSSLFRRLGMGLILTWVIFVSFVSILEARTWGDSKSFALSALVDRPDSYRARQEAVAFFLANGEYLTAANLLYSINDDFKIYAGTHAQLLLLKCYDEDIPLPPVSKIRKVFRTAPTDLGVEMAFHDLWRIKRKGLAECSHVTWSQLLNYIDDLTSNESFSRSRNLKLIASFINADNRNYELAIDILKKIPSSQEDFPLQILIARFYIMGEKPNEALRVVEGLLESELSIDKLIYGKYLREMKDSLLEHIDS